MNRMIVTLLFMFSLALGAERSTTSPQMPSVSTDVTNEIRQYLSNIIQFNVWSKQVSAIQVELKHGIIFYQTTKADYGKRNDAKTYVQHSNFLRSIVLDVKREESQHYFYDNVLSNECSVNFFPEQMMVSVRSTFLPYEVVYYYEMNIFWATGTNVRGETVYSGSLISYARDEGNDKGLTIVVFPIKAKVILEKNAEPPKNNRKPEDRDREPESRKVSTGA